MSKAGTTDGAQPKDGYLTWEQILPWQRDNEYILSRYRKSSFSYLHSLRSMLRIHNETANIWSHLLGACLFAGLTYHLVTSLSDIADTALPVDAIAIAIYDLCVVTCFLLSTINHTFSDHSRDMHKFVNELDHLGIVLVMWGSGVSSNYFGFYCDETLRNSYVLLITTTAIGCAVFTLQPRFREPRFRPMRVLMYVFQGFSLFAPCFHGLWLYGWEILNMRMSVDHFIGLAVINGSGAAIYAARIPEKWYPRTFDLLGQSHNLMHIMVLCGALVRRRGLLMSLRYWERAQALGLGCSIRA